MLLKYLLETNCIRKQSLETLQVAERLGNHSSGKVWLLCNHWIVYNLYEKIIISLMVKSCHLGAEVHVLLVSHLYKIILLWLQIIK